MHECLERVNENGGRGTEEETEIEECVNNNRPPVTERSDTAGRPIG